MNALTYCDNCGERTATARLGGLDAMLAAVRDAEEFYAFIAAAAPEVFTLYHGPRRLAAARDAIARAGDAPRCTAADGRLATHHARGDHASCPLHREASAGAPPTMRVSRESNGHYALRNADGYALAHVYTEYADLLPTLAASTDLRTALGALLCSIQETWKLEPKHVTAIGMARDALARAEGR